MYIRNMCVHTHETKKTIMVVLLQITQEKTFDPDLKYIQTFSQKDLKRNDKQCVRDMKAHEVLSKKVVSSMTAGQGVFRELGTHAIDTLLNS